VEETLSFEEIKKIIEKNKIQDLDGIRNFINFNIFNQIVGMICLEKDPAQITNKLQGMIISDEIIRDVIAIHKDRWFFPYLLAKTEQFAYLLYENSCDYLSKNIIEEIHNNQEYLFKLVSLGFFEHDDLILI